jgi:hypothetical protein
MAATKGAQRIAGSRSPIPDARLKAIRIGASLSKKRGCITRPEDLLVTPVIEGGGFSM